MSANRRLFMCWVVLAGCGDVKGTQDAAATCTPACRPGFACVEGTCISECNPVCDTGFTCTQGACIADCSASEVRCGTECIDPLTDAMYCGAKGTCSGSDATAADFAGATCGAAACVSGACAVSGLVISAPTSNYNVFTAAGSPTTAVQLNVRVATGITVGSTTPAMPAFTTGALPAGSTVTLVIDGQIVGAGGVGGSGGNGGGGTTPPCGRPGGVGGTAIVLTVPTTITNNGLIAGGGGGGGGMSGCNINGGGGGGAGSIVGSGGAQASLAAGVAAPAASETAFCGQDNGIRTGSAGTAGSATTGGAGGDPASTGAGGRGGDLGRTGLAALSCINDTVGGNGAGPGGVAGFAIRRGTQTLTIADGAYATGTGPIRGAVGP